LAQNVIGLSCLGPKPEMPGSITEAQIETRIGPNQTAPGFLFVFFFIVDAY
jgi:hypothetical protein